MILPRVIIFDWDDTLAENWSALTYACNTALSTFGIPEITQEDMRARSSKSLRQQFPEIFGDRWLEAQTLFYDAYEKRHIDTLQARPGAADLLRELRRRGIRMAIVSNKNGDILRREVSALGWDTYFSHVIGAMDAPEDKPDPIVVKMAMEGMPETPPESVWLVGDQPSDLACAHNSGCLPVLMNPGDIESPIPPAHHVPDCDGLKLLIARMFDTICL
ncbi:MAG TPA: HAD family hydrolase [Rhodospirillaceae bacterium]|nr:MAG: hypothetical protein A2018_04215 [Alphaproteobacteria bacterium GWF2_58_20]HAU28725.1 HAD family hydrolase [Rhodospirillaceae bacterium]